MTPQGTRVLLVRHGESVVTVNRVVGGPRSCTGLTDLGRRQALRLHDRLVGEADPSVDVLVSSAYPRALQTAEIIAPALGSPSVMVVPEFGEHDPGPQCDGLTYDEFIRRHGRPDFAGDPDAEFFPGGETISAFHRRVHGALDQVIAEHAGRTVLVACHGGVIDAVLRRCLGARATGGFDVWTRNCSVTDVVEVRPGHWALLRYNDHAHLHGLPTSSARA